jgi:hypothetical protein
VVPLTFVVSDSDKKASFFVATRVDSPKKLLEFAIKLAEDAGGLTHSVLVYSCEDNE